MKRMLVLCAAILVVSALSLGAAQGRSGAQVVKESCASCHNLRPVCGNLGQDAAYWNRTVARMVRNGARLQSGEVEETAGFLAGLKPGAAEACR
jgi:cytochrome c5